MPLRHQNFWDIINTTAYHLGQYYLLLTWLEYCTKEEVNVRLLVQTFTFKLGLL